MKYNTNHQLLQNILSTYNLDSLAGEILLNLYLHKSLNINRLAIEKCVSRTKIYNLLQQLKELYLVKQDDKGKWQPESPTRLMSLIRSREIGLKQARDEMGSLLPDLLGSYNANHSSQYIRFYEGREEFITLFNEALELSPNEFLYFGDVEKFIKIIGLEYQKSWTGLRVYKKIPTRMITYPAMIFDWFDQRNKEQYRQVKYLDKSRFLARSCFWVFNNSVIFWNPDLARCILIEDSNIASTQRAIFEALWVSI